jgi:hypothetical protein
MGITSRGMVAMDAELIEAKKIAFRVCGTTNIEQAFQLVEQERVAMVELHDRNTAQAIHIKRLDDAFQSINTLIAEVEKMGEMFLSARARAAIVRYRGAYAEIERRLQEALRL